MKLLKAISTPRPALAAFSLPFSIPSSLVMAALCLGACSFTPAPVIRYRAESTGALWERGTEFHVSRARSLEIRTGFLDVSTDNIMGYQSSRQLLFMVSAENRSDSAALLDPLDFHMKILGRDSILESIDPEAVILRARQDQAAKDAAYAGTLGTGLVLGLGETVLDVAAIFSPKTKDQQEEWEEGWDSRPAPMRRPPIPC